MGEAIYPLSHMSSWRDALSQEMSPLPFLGTGCFMSLTELSESVRSVQCAA